MISESEAHNLARQGAAAFGLDVDSIRLVQHLVNASFAVTARQGAFHLRVTSSARRSPSELASEAAFVAALRAAECPVPEPLRSSSGAWAWTDPSLQHHITVRRWLPGELLPNDRRSPIHFERVGELLAALHFVSRTWTRPAWFERPSHCATTIFASAPHLPLAPEIRADLARAADAMRQADETLARSERRGLIHGDASFGNILFEKDVPWLIDFDDCGDGVFAFDLAVVLAGAWGKPDFNTNAAALLAGYERHRPLLTEERTALPALMAARAATLLLWAAGEQSSHPWISAQHARLVSYLASPF